MILEMAVLDVKAGSVAAFETAIGKARPLIEATEGFQKLEVRPCLETENRYLLLVWWDSLESHTIGFRQSERYQKWREALHDFYDPFPLVEHFAAPL
jgi:heme-degrading monooxygenase HmoA